MPDNSTANDLTGAAPTMTYAAYFPFITNDLTLNSHTLRGEHTTSSEFDTSLFTQILSDESPDTFSRKAFEHQAASGHGKANRTDFSTHIKPTHLKQSGVVHHISIAIDQMARGRRHFALNNLAAAQRRTFADAFAILGPTRAVEIIEADLSTHEPAVRQVGLAHLWHAAYQHQETSLEGEEVLTELTDKLAEGQLALAKRLADALVGQPFGFDHLSGENQSVAVFTDDYTPQLEQHRARTRSDFIGSVRPRALAQTPLVPTPASGSHRPSRNSRAKEQSIGVILYYTSDEYPGLQRMRGGINTLKLPVGGAIDTTRAALVAHIADRRELMYEHDARIWQTRQKHPDLAVTRARKSVLFHHLRAGLAVTTKNDFGKVQSVRTQLNELDSRRRAGLTDLIATVPPLEVGHIVADAFDQAVELSTRPKFAANVHAFDVLRATQTLASIFNALDVEDPEATAAYHEILVRLTEQLAYAEKLQGNRANTTCQTIATTCVNFDLTGNDAFARFQETVLKPLIAYRIANQKSYADIGEELPFRDTGNLKWRAGKKMPTPAGDFHSHYSFFDTQTQPSGDAVIIFPYNRALHEYHLTLAPGSRPRELRAEIDRLILSPLRSANDEPSPWAQGLRSRSDLAGVIEELLQMREQVPGNMGKPIFQLREFVGHFNQERHYVSWQKQVDATHGLGAQLNAPYLAALIAAAIAGFRKTPDDDVVEHAAWIEDSADLLESMLNQTDAWPEELEKVSTLCGEILESIEIYVRDQNADKLRERISGLDISTLHGLRRPDMRAVMEEIFGDEAQTLLGTESQEPGQRVAVHITSVETRVNSPARSPIPIAIALGGNVAAFYDDEALKENLRGPLLISKTDNPAEVNIRNPHGPQIGSTMTAANIFMELLRLPQGHDFEALELLIAAKVAAHADALTEKGALPVLRDQMFQLLADLKAVGNDQAQPPNAATADANLPELARTLNALAIEMADAERDQQIEAANWALNGHELVASLVDIVVSETPIRAGVRLLSDPETFVAEAQLALKAAETLRLGPNVDAHRAWAKVREIPYTTATSPMLPLPQRHLEELRAQRLGGTTTVTLTREPARQLPPGSPRHTSRPGIQ